MGEKNIKVHIMHCGTVSVDRTLCYRGDCLPYMNPDGIDWVTLPCSTYLIEHPKGNILVDTSWHRDIRSNPQECIGEPLCQLFPGDLPEGEAVDERLAAFGMTPGDIDYVLMTHLHCDHASGMKMVADAKHMLVSRIELDAANGNPAHYATKMWDGLDLETFEYQDTWIGPLGKSFDLFGDGTLLLVATPGHTPGQSSILVGSLAGFVVLCGDVAYGPKSWEDKIEGGAAIDARLALQSLSWLSLMSEMPGCMGIVANHDTDLANIEFEIPYCPTR